MLASSANRVLVALLAALLAVTSVTAARMMLPERSDPAKAAYEELATLLHSELCRAETPHASNDHHCPLCHGLPEAPEVAWAGRIFPVAAFRTLPGLAHLLSGARDRDLSRSPRGPPVRA